MMNKNTVALASGILLCARQVMGQSGLPTPLSIQRRAITPTPEQRAAAQAKSEQCRSLDMAGFTALHEGRHSEAEANARQSLTISHGYDLLAPELLAQSLDAQGKNAEALAAYQTLVDQGSDFPRILLPYALLLLKEGQYAGAVAAYSKAAPHIAFGRLIAKTSSFTATAPQPKELAAAIHVGLGLTYLSSVDWAGNSCRDQGLAHFQQALVLSPNSPLANYYLGYGLNRLGRQAEAQAAFRKAAALGQGDIKEAAEKELP